MSFFDRALLTVFSFLVSLVLLISFFVLGGWTTPLDFLFDAYTLPEQKQILGIITAAFFLAGARLFWIGIRRTPKPSGPEPVKSVVVENELGQVRIALTAIANLVEKVVAEFQGVREIKAGITSGEEGIIINVSMTVSPEIRIPEISKEIQTRVREKVLEVTGTSADDIRVSVENIATGKVKVE